MCHANVQAKTTFQSKPHESERLERFVQKYLEQKAREHQQQAQKTVKENVRRFLEILHTLDDERSVCRGILARQTMKTDVVNHLRRHELPEMIQKGD